MTTIARQFAELLVQLENALTKWDKLDCLNRILALELASGGRLAY